MKKFLLFNTYERISDWLFPLAVVIAWTWLTGLFSLVPYS